MQEEARHVSGKHKASSTELRKQSSAVYGNSVFISKNSKEISTDTYNIDLWNMILWYTCPNQHLLLFYEEK